MAEKRFTTTSQKELDCKDIIDGSVVFKTIGNVAEVRACKYVFHLHPSSYGRKYFLVYNGKLRQFKLIRTFLCPWNYNIKNNGKRIEAIHQLEICGIGNVFIAHRSGSGSDFPCKVYYSVETYKKGDEVYLGYEADNLAKLNPFGISLEYDHSYFHGENDYVAKMWRWNGTAAVSENIHNVPMFYSFDGKDYDVTSKCELPSGYYTTKEECEKDNAIEVEYFAEEEPKTTTETILGVKCELTDDEKKKIKELISSFSK